MRVGETFLGAVGGSPQVWPVVRARDGAATRGGLRGVRREVTAGRARKVRRALSERLSRVGRPLTEAIRSGACAS